MIRKTPLSSIMDEVVDEHRVQRPHNKQLLRAGSAGHRLLLTEGSVTGRARGSDCILPMLVHVARDGHMLDTRMCKLCPPNGWVHQNAMRTKGGMLIVSDVPFCLSLTIASPMALPPTLKAKVYDFTRPKTNNKWLFIGEQLTQTIIENHGSDSLPFLWDGLT